jgi:hypothetical protein
LISGKDGLQPEKKEPRWLETKVIHVHLGTKIWSINYRIT